jgi:hypothetical protein
MAESNNTDAVRFKFTYSNLPDLILSIIGVTSNVLLLIAFKKDPLKCFRNSGTYLVMNLSVCDCLACAFAPFFNAVKISGRFQIFECIVLWSTSASLLSILSISIDRYFMVAFPLRRHVLMDGKVTVVWLAAVWIISCTLPVLRVYDGNRTDHHIQKYTFGTITIILSAMFYVCTYRKLKKQSKNIALQNSIGSRAERLRILKEKQFLKTIIVVACVAFVCIVPPLVVFQLYVLLAAGRNKFAATILRKLFILLFYTNFVVNPFIYVMRLPNYRKTFRILYCRKGS